MAHITFLPGITSRIVQTPRLTQHVLTSGAEDGEPIVFVHGAISSAVFWEETLLALPARYRAIAPDLRGFGESESAPLDATRGVRDYADDLHSLLENLGLERFHLVGWSLGGGIAMQYTRDHHERVASLTLIAPLPPYGMSGTKDAGGTPTWPDFAGSGGGTASPEFVKLLMEGDRSSASPNSPRNVLNQLWFHPPFRATPEREEVFMNSILSTVCGDDYYPGDMTPSNHWPHVAPGTKGLLNATSPRYYNLGSFGHIQNGPPVLWIYGANDQVFSDAALTDPGVLGQLGLLPEWPGAAIYPPQPTWTQIRLLLDTYTTHGGSYREVILANTGHSSPIERPDEFRQAVFHFIAEATFSIQK